MQSDCDFLIPVAGPIIPEQEAALRVLHDQLPTRQEHWSRHLEGSYPQLAQLSSLRGLGVPWLYVDHGWRQMQWSDALRQRMRRDIPTALSDKQGWISLDIAWAQRYAVTTLCRMLYTLDSGQVASKKSALVWAGENLEPRWQPLFRQADEDRALGFDPDAVPREGSVSTTLAFAGYARAIARR